MSPLLATIYGHVVEMYGPQQSSALGHLTRYADDGAPRRRGKEATMVT